MNVDLLKMIYLSHKGRVNRFTYWVYSLPLAIMYLPLIIFPDAINEYLLLLIALFVMYPAMMINIKRCHDRGRSGFFSLILFLPLISLWPLIELGFIRGSNGENKYGSDPLS